VNELTRNNSLGHLKMDRNRYIYWCKD